MLPAPRPHNGPDDTPDPELVRHELMTPLTVIYARSDLMRRRLAHMDGLAAQDRIWLDFSLATIQERALELGAGIDAELPWHRA